MSGRDWNHWGPQETPPPAPSGGYSDRERTHGMERTPNRHGGEAEPDPWKAAAYRERARIIAQQQRRRVHNQQLHGARHGDHGGWDDDDDELDYMESGGRSHYSSGGSIRAPEPAVLRGQESYGKSRRSQSRMPRPELLSDSSDPSSIERNHRRSSSKSGRHSKSQSRVGSSASAAHAAGAMRSASKSGHRIKSRSHSKNGHRSSSRSQKSRSESRNRSSRDVVDAHYSSRSASKQGRSSSRQQSGRVSKQGGRSSSRNQHMVTFDSRGRIERGGAWGGGHISPQQQSGGADPWGVEPKDEKCTISCSFGVGSLSKTAGCLFLAVGLIGVTVLVVVLLGRLLVPDGFLKV